MQELLSMQMDFQIIYLKKILYKKKIEINTKPFWLV